MDLVMLKDAYKNEFLRNTLLAMTGNGSPDVLIGFWMGLSLQSSGWTYVDGTSLSSSFNGWLSGQPAPNCPPCGILLTTSNYQLRWFPNTCDPLASYPQWNYIAVCEYSYSFLETEADQLCLSNPCQNGGTCQPVLYSGVSTTSCVCPYPMGGATCSDLICSNCFRYNEYVLYLIGGQSVSWVDAHTTCTNNGYNVVVIKDSNKGTAVLNWLSSINTATSQNGYWMGASRNSSTTQFFYDDGTVVNDSVYSDWVPGRPVDGQCVVLLIGSDYNLQWYDDNCLSTGINSNWNYISTCEKSYTFLATNA